MLVGLYKTKALEEDRVKLRDGDGRCHLTCRCFGKSVPLAEQGQPGKEGSRNAGAALSCVKTRQLELEEN